ncbi:hypothetical protein H8957_013222, partial [Semnopithecus entellus]
MDSAPAGSFSASCFFALSVTVTRAKNSRGPSSPSELQGAHCLTSSLAAVWSVAYSALWSSSPLRSPWSISSITMPRLSSGRVLSLTPRGSRRPPSSASLLALLGQPVASGSVSTTPTAPPCVPGCPKRRASLPRHFPRTLGRGLRSWRGGRLPGGPSLRGLRGSVIQQQASHLPQDPRVLSTVLPQNPPDPVLARDLPGNGSV